MVFDAFVVFLMVCVWLGVVVGVLWLITQILGVVFALVEGEPVRYTPRRKRSAAGGRPGMPAAG